MLTLAELLQRLPDCPEIEEATPLQGGSVSRKWLLQSQIGPLVLRADEPVAGRLGLSRQRELDALRAAGPLAPEVICAIPADGLLLLRYLQGTVADETELAAPSRVLELGTLLGELHGREAPDCPVVDYAAAAAGYACVAGDSRAEELAADVARLAARWCSEPDRYVLCHHDPGPGNVVLQSGAGPMRLIDWEYAGRGEPCMDLAAVLCGPAQNTGDALLRGYGRSVDSARLKGCSAIYRRLAALWLMAVCSATDAPRAYYRALQKLLAALSAGYGDG